VKRNENRAVRKGGKEGESAEKDNSPGYSGRKPRQNQRFSFGAFLESKKEKAGSGENIRPFSAVIVRRGGL